MAASRLVNATIEDQRVRGPLSDNAERADATLPRHALKKGRCWAPCDGACWMGHQARCTRPDPHAATLRPSPGPTDERRQRTGRQSAGPPSGGAALVARGLTIPSSAASAASPLQRVVRRFCDALPSWERRPTTSPGSGSSATFEGVNKARRDFSSDVTAAKTQREPAP